MNVLSRASQDLTDLLRRYPVLVLVPISILVGVALTLSGSPLIVGGLLVLVPVCMLQIAVIRNLFLGIVAYLMAEYLQPGFRFPVLAVVHPALLVAASLLLAWVLNVMQHRARVVINWQVKSYVIFLLLGLFSSFAAISVGMVKTALITMTKTLAVFFVLYSVVDTVPKLRKLIWTYVYLHLILSVMAFGLFFTTGNRQMGDLGGSFLGDENDSAMALLIMVPYTYFMLGQTRRKLLRVALFSGMVLSSAAVLFSFSRGAFVGFLAMVAYVWSNSSRKAAAAIVLVTIVLGLFAVMPDTYWDRIESVKNYQTEGSAQGRIDAWKGGIHMMLDSPLIGAGLGNFNRTYGTRYNTISERWTAAHSMYIQFIGELGVPGLLFIVTTILLTLRTYRRVRRRCQKRKEPEFQALLAMMRGAECGFVAYLVCTIFLNSMSYPHLWHFGAVAGCGALALDDLYRRLGKQEDINLAPPAAPRPRGGRRRARGARSSHPAGV